MCFMSVNAVHVQECVCVCVRTHMPATPALYTLLLALITKKSIATLQHCNFALQQEQSESLLNKQSESLLT